ncbi:MAG: CopD family protein [Maricaulaceae bacterium]|jgi:putative membrane protein
MTGFLNDYYNWLRALHILMVIAWMAGMLYLPRLFVHHMGATPDGELEQSLKLQERRLLKIIVNPSMIGAWAFGLLMLWAHWGPIMQTGAYWFHPKFLLVLILSGIHGFYAGAQKKFARGERPRTEKFWRMMNEIPALLAIGIVILAVVEPF